MSLTVSVHIAPNTWPEKITEIRQKYNEVVEEFQNISSSSLGKFAGDKIVSRKLHEIVEQQIEPIGNEFRASMEAQGFDVEVLGNMAVSNIIHAKPTRLTKPELYDKVHFLLREVYMQGPPEHVLLNGLEKYMTDLGKKPNDKEIIDMAALCKKYLGGNEVGIFGSMLKIVSSMRNQEYPNFENATWGSCFYLQKENTNRTIQFQCALLLPPIMYVLPCRESAFIGEKGWGLLDQIVLEYKQPSLISLEFLANLQSANPMHLAPIVGNLLSDTQINDVRPYLSEAYNMHFTLTHPKGGAQTSLFHNVFIPAAAYYGQKTPKTKAVKDSPSKWQTLDIY